MSIMISIWYLTLKIVKCDGKIVENLDGEISKNIFLFLVSKLCKNAIVSIYNFLVKSLVWVVVCWHLFLIDEISY